MRYSLLNRFRGALLGSLVGEILAGSGCQKLPPAQVRFRPLSLGDAGLSKAISDWSKIATCGIESLIRCGNLDLGDWLVHCEKAQPSILSLKGTANSSEAAVATLPIALFFHEDEVKLRQKLLQAAAIWQNDSQRFESVLTIAWAIAIALTEKLDCPNLISRIIAYLGNYENQNTWVEQLEQLQSLLELGASLEQTVIQLRREQRRRNESEDDCSLSIALALYCFLNTPEDFRLCVTRAALTGYQSQTTAALTGALAGAYNGIISIPVPWLVALNLNITGVDPWQLADQLLAVWSGVYDVSAIAQFQKLAVVAPRVIGSR
ncbi:MULTISPECIES: ADP-ribosylglycohydrolase family protein [unclassified Moorena]|uniref:ADP-ribosylglycohydrolase family protein n=1 Tax=unclassified Moorena TaxID=2683338 RepID=UPI0013C165B6|nr:MULTISPECIES: ADP-ribosylglycohydrolase family protein [unclassified Moorena]NEO08554.1 ADP-ribosylglycohydrolase family protein [Moorena sp. SIO3I8]NEO21683.1 ADP-ribosylglycohydrolase family protein [Moorena sp. SIO4A5]NEP26510.1 ADP-ribosylglycohydrolase family protein [Moorena sp. SIO3I6]NEQ59308.1 ADP-ribosylglycohydrolase family protein [Moorena sp. SIO4A1]